MTRTVDGIRVRKKRSPEKTLFDKAWKLMREYVRKRDTDWRGYGNCCTCGKTVEYKKAHAGHYRHAFLDFDERNINLQCNSCNTYRGGELDKYTIFLIKKYGIEIIEELDTLFHAHKLKADQTGKKYTVDELTEIIKDLQIKIARIQ